MGEVTVSIFAWSRLGTRTLHQRGVIEYHVPGCYRGTLWAGPVTRLTITMEGRAVRVGR